jgi:hypothetical protein
MSVETFLGLIETEVEGKRLTLRDLVSGEPLTFERACSWAENVEVKAWAGILAIMRSFRRREIAFALLRDQCLAATPKIDPSSEELSIATRQDALDLALYPISDYVETARLSGALRAGGYQDRGVLIPVSWLWLVAVEQRLSDPQIARAWELAGDDGLAETRRRCNGESAHSQALSSVRSMRAKVKRRYPDLRVSCRTDDFGVTNWPEDGPAPALIDHCEVLVHPGKSKLFVLKKMSPEQRALLEQLLKFAVPVIRWADGIAHYILRGGASFVLME